MNTNWLTLLELHCNSFKFVKKHLNLIETYSPESLSKYLLYMILGNSIDEDDITSTKEL